MKKLYQKIQSDIRSHKNKKAADVAQRFFKTGPGQYGEGDIFLGLNVPTTRKLVKKYIKEIDLNTLSQIIKSKYHEERLFALASLAELSKKAYKTANQNDDAQQKKLLETYKNFYFKNIEYINNWDLIDVTAEHVVGSYYFSKSKADLIKLAHSKSIWEKRVSILSTFYFIRRNEYKTAIQICKILITDKHDLIHKATGWMLREIGKRDIKVLHKFLKSHAHIMPRTMLRYSIEKLTKAERKKYLSQGK